MRVFFMGLLQTDNSECVSWILSNFKRFISKEGAVVQSAKLVACDGKYSIVTQVRTLFPTSNIVMYDWHFNENIFRRASSFTSRCECPHSFDDMKKYIHVLLSARPVPFFYNSRRSFENKYFGASQV